MKANLNNAPQPLFSVTPPAALGEAFGAKPFEAVNNLFKIWSSAQAEMMEQSAQASQKWLALMAQLQVEPPKTLRGMMLTMVAAQRRGYEEWRRELRALNDAAARCAYESAECASELLPDQDLSPQAILEPLQPAGAKPS